MAQCVTLNADGTLTATGQSVAECTGYVLVSGSEYGVLNVVNQALGVPTQEQAAAWLVGPFSFVVGSYLIAAMAGKVANFFNR